MSNKNDSGDRTEKPTPKRLKDARKRGEVSKSKDVTATIGLVVWIIMGFIAIGFVGGRLAGLSNDVFSVVAAPSRDAMINLAYGATGSVIAILLLVISPVIVVSLLAEFLQVGPVLTLEKVKPRLSHLNLADGLKRMISVDNLVEVLKSVIKTSLLLGVGWLLTWSMFLDLRTLPMADAGAFAAVLIRMTFVLMVWTVIVFALVSAVDAAYQRHSFIKKMMMSRRDIKQEMKEMEGDPDVKGQRKQLHQEWSAGGGPKAAGAANALLVNPTHFAVAIDFDAETNAPPFISAKGQGEMAQRMRAAADKNGVPVLRDVPLTRTLYARLDEGEEIPSDLFDAVAIVIVWARRVREQAAHPAAPNAAAAKDEKLPEKKGDPS